MHNNYYFSLRRHPTETILFQLVKTCLKIFSPLVDFIDRWIMMPSSFADDDLILVTLACNAPDGGVSMG